MFSPIITLTTDFGSRDPYLGAMKGVVLRINPDAVIVDVSADVPAQDVGHGAFVIGNTYRYFPLGTIHVCVVDPGVGTARYPIILVTPEAHFIAPDNGLLTYVLLDRGTDPLTEHNRVGDDSPKTMDLVSVPVPDGCEAYVLNRPEFWLDKVSDTFHGRDIFAPVAGHLTAGTPPDAMGDRLDGLNSLYISQLVYEGETLHGSVIYVDGFGNLVTNMRLDGRSAGGVEVEIKGERIQHVSRSYASSAGLLSVVGSHGYVEIAVRKGSAAEQLDAAVGTPVTINSPDGAPRLIRRPSRD